MIKLIISAARKVQGDEQFSSRHAGITIEGEVADASAIPNEAQRLLALAESEVLRHLGSQTAAPVQASAARSQPRPSGNGRGAPRPASAAQVRYLRQLVAGEPHAEAALCQENGVTRLEELPSRACSAAIDRIKGVAR